MEEFSSIAVRARIGVSPDLAMVTDDSYERFPDLALPARYSYTGTEDSSIIGEFQLPHNFASSLGRMLPRPPLRTTG
jgi:hypothetical protein